MPHSYVYRHPLQDFTDAAAHTIWAKALEVTSAMAPGASAITVVTDPDPRIPTLLHLPFLLNGYHRNPGHVTLGEQPLMVANMGFNKSPEPVWREFIVHEICHWLQDRLSNFKPTRDTHTHASWSDACWIAAQAFDCERPREFYRPLTSVRIGGVVRKRQREGSLTLKELHHFPTGLPMNLMKF